MYYAYTPMHDPSILSMLCLVPCLHALPCLSVSAGSSGAAPAVCYTSRILTAQYCGRLAARTLAPTAICHGLTAQYLGRAHILRMPTATYCRYWRLDAMRAGYRHIAQAMQSMADNASNTKTIIPSIQNQIMWLSLLDIVVAHVTLYRLYYHLLYFQRWVYTLFWSRRH